MKWTTSGCGNKTTSGVSYNGFGTINSYPSNTTSKGGGGSISGGGGVGSQSGGFDHRLHQLHPRDAETFIERIKASESEIQRLANQYRPLNPKCSEESLRSSAIITLGIATDKELEGIKNYKIEQEKAVSKIHHSDSPQEKALAVNVAQKITPYVLALNPSEISLGIHTASFEGRKSKDIDGISNQVKICLEHLRIHGGVDALRVLTFMQCDLTTIDMIYFGNTMLQYSLLLKYLDFSDNRIGDIGTISFINSFVTSPTGKYPMHHIINLNLNNNNIGDDGAAHIAAYLKHGYMPATTHVNLANNIITDTGAAHLAESLNSSVNKLKVLHLEGNKLNPLHSNPKLIQVVTNMKTHVKILVSRMSDIVDGVKKQGNLFFGSKEDKQAIVKDILKQAQENGVDVKNVTVSKNIFEAILNYGKLKIDFSLGWVKCTLVPDSVKSFAADQIIAKASPLVGQVKLAMDITTCYFETFDESVSSKEGVQFMGDIGFITQSELLNVIE